MRLRLALSVIENGLLAMNPVVVVPLKLSGFVAGAADVLSSGMPGVLVGFAPCVLAGSAKKLSVDSPDPTAELKVNDPLSVTLLVGGTKLVSLAKRPTVIGAPVSLMMLELDSCKSLSAPNVL
jgi:hypothetical protein